jgi:hypothetical protein
VVSQQDRAHFDLIAVTEQELAREAVEECAQRTPGENIALGFELSEFASAFGGDVSHPEDVSPASLWRTRSRAGPS